MEDNEMPSPEELRKLLRGEIEPRRAREIYVLLAESDEALDLAEGIWAEESPLGAEGSPRLSSRRGDQIERQVFRSVHRTHLAEDAARLGSGAFLHVVLELLRAALSIFRPAGSSKTSHRRTP